LKKYLVSIGLLILVLTGLSISSAIHTEESIKSIAEGILKEDLTVNQVRMDAFVFDSVSRFGVFNWIVDWRLINDPKKRIGVSFSLADVDVTADRVIPDCKNNKYKTIEYYGDICWVKN
jgi:hypothetical protein